MVRTVVNFDDNDKKWLDELASERHIPMTEIVRQAVHYYRQKIESDKELTFEELLKKTAGLWKKGDGLAYQKKLRKEWE